MADKFHRRCCYNCTHHLDYHMEGKYADTVVCSIKAEKDMGNYIGVDYDQRINADHAPCKDWKVDTNVPKGFHWGFEEPRQLTIQFDNLCYKDSTHKPNRSTSMSVTRCCPSSAED